MKEKLEKVIAELSKEVGMCEVVLESDPYDAEAKASKWAFELAIMRLKEVLADEGEHRTQHHIPTEKET